MRWRGVVAVWAVGLLAAAVVQALSAGEIRARAKAIGGASGDATVERQRVGELGDLVLAFIELSDDAARAGGEGGRRDELRGAFEAIDAPLESIYQSRATQLEALTRGVMDQDGDLEALYESAEFRDSQGVAAASLYYRNWLRYYGARLYDGARRKELLAAAEKGFSELATADQKRDLLTESLLGRGLCHLELGDTDAAVQDFKLVIADASVSPERQAKARLAMLDAYGRAGRTQDALRFSEEILRGGGVPAGDVTLVRFVRLQTLFDAADKAKGADGERYRREAAALMDTLRGAGKGWADRVDALMVARVDDPRAWAGKAETPRVQWELARLMLTKSDYEGAVPLLQTLVASSDPDARALKPEAEYWLGVARFKANDPAAAAAAFDAALATPGEWAGEARYLRFKALETLVAQPAVIAAPGAAPGVTPGVTPGAAPGAAPGGTPGGTPGATPGATRAGPGAVDRVLQERYHVALVEFLDKNPTHPFAYEARYRLGEYEQSGGQFEIAIATYARVQGDAATVLRARFGTLQSRFELLKGDVDPAARAARLATIGADLDAVEAQSKALPAKSSDVALQELQARTTLLRAVYLSLRGEGGDAQVAALLADFAQRFPQQTELLPQAVRLRLGALLALDRFDDAQKAVTQYGAALQAEQRDEQLDGLATGFARAAARRKASGDAVGAAAAAKTALALYGLLGASGGGKQQLAMAHLQENSGDLAGAAQMFAAALAADPNNLVALRGLARIEEAQGKRAEAQARWATYTSRSRPGDPGWFQGEYQQARLELAGGKKAESCARLSKLRPAMPGLSDADLRRDLTTLYDQACD